MERPTRSTAIRLLVALAAAATLSAAPGGAVASPEATVPEREGYVVVLRDDVEDVARVAARQTAALGTVPHHVYRRALRGYAASLTRGQAARLALDPAVAHVEPDATVTVETIQTFPPWGLDRIDQRKRPLDGLFSYTRTGAGVTAYVIDTGIRSSHQDFGDRVVAGFNAVGASPEDCHGHGTHVAGTIGGTTHGVAKKVTLVSVRVLNCAGSGKVSSVIAGVDWVTGEHPGGPAVANMSLGARTSKALDTAVKRSITSGITYVVSAGNGGGDACVVSPARVKRTLTVSATNRKDGRATWANYGSCVSLFAPGAAIRSATNTSDSATRDLSGTSMAAPHATGVAALYLEGAPAARPNAVRGAIRDLATKGIVGRPRGSPNRLLFTDL